MSKGPNLVLTANSHPLLIISPKLIYQYSCFNVAGSSINGHSKEELAATVTGTGATAQWRLIRGSEDPANSDKSAANSNWIVRLNESIYYAGVVLT